MFRERHLPGALLPTLALAALTVLGLAASAQYPSGYPYQKPTSAPSFKGPNMAGGLSTFGGNPYQKQYYPPTGLATGSKYGFGSVPSSVGNPLTHAPVQKPFSGLKAPQPLVTSMEAAQISVRAQLWGGYYGY